MFTSNFGAQTGVSSRAHAPVMWTSDVIDVAVVGSTK